MRASGAVVLRIAGVVLLRGQPEVNRTRSRFAAPGGACIEAARLADCTVGVGGAEGIGDVDRVDVANVKAGPPTVATGGVKATGERDLTCAVALARPLGRASCCRQRGAVGVLDRLVASSFTRSRKGDTTCTLVASRTRKLPI